MEETPRKAQRQQDTGLALFAFFTVEVCLSSPGKSALPGNQKA